MIGELRDALSNIKTLRRLIPICSSCKKIRNGKGYRQQVEKYVKERTDADFRHGIYEDCTKRLYPDLFKKLTLNPMTLFDEVAEKNIRIS